MATPALARATVVRRVFIVILLMSDPASVTGARMDGRSPRPRGRQTLKISCSRHPSTSVARPSVRREQRPNTVREDARRGGGGGQAPRGVVHLVRSGAG